MVKKIIVALAYGSLVFCAQNKKPVQPSEQSVESALDVVTTVKPVQNIIAGYVGAAFSEIATLWVSVSSNYLWHLQCVNNIWVATPAELRCLIKARPVAGATDIWRTICEHAGEEREGDGKITIEFLALEILRVKISSPDGRYCASAFDRSIQITDTQAYAFSKLLGWHKRILKACNCQIYALAYSPDGRYLGHCSAGCMHVWDIQSGKVIVTKQPEEGWRYKQIWFIDGNLVLLSHKNNDNNASAKISFYNFSPAA